jgi:hypothetical protein
MPTQKGGYFTADGTRVPSVTTIISRFKDSGGLIHWAWQQGRDGKDYRETRDAAADAGTCAHALVESFIRGTAVVAPTAYGEEVIEKGTRAFENFRRWADQTRLVSDHPETAMVSERHRFGGTLDAVTLEGKRAILDWKSSNALYHDYLMQVAAYGMLWTESHPDDPIVGGYHIVRFSKTDADFEHRFFQDLADAERMFLLLREAYDLDQNLKRRLR